MKREQHRHTIIPRVDPLPKAEPRPCMRGVLDIDLYNKTGEVKYIQPLTEFVPPQNVEADVEIDRMEKRRFRKLNVNKPSKEKLTEDLLSGMYISDIAKKYEASVSTVNSWIKLYGLKGIKKKSADPDMVQESPPIDMVQTGPTLEEIEQFHTDVPVQELPKVGMDKPEPMAAESPRETFDEIWDDVHSDLVTLEKLYVKQAKKSFRERLQEMLAAILAETKEEKQVG